MRGATFFSWTLDAGRRTTMSNDTMKDKLSRLDEAYSKKTGWRALVNLIPYVGGSLDVLLTSKAHKLTEQRIESLLAELAQQVGTVDESKIDKDFLESEEWYDMVFRAFEKAIRTRSLEKIKLYSKILVGSLTNPDNRDHSEDFLEILSELSETEVRLARIIYDLREVHLWDRDGQGLPMPNKFLEQCTFIDRNDLPFYMNRLEKVGLIDEQMGSFIDYEGGLYKITPTFDKLMKVIA